MTGLKVARACPPISHLLFTDGSLFFCKPQRDECETILNILEEYKVVSAKQINFQKSSSKLSHKVEETTRTEIRDILGIHNIGEMRSYLGIPESLEEPKAQIFCFIQERLHNRVNGWTIRYLTKGGTI